MPRVKPEDRKRARRPKTRGGCITCKIRRVKCDEGRPFCGRCVATGRKCDGYDQYAEEEVSLVAPAVQFPSVFDCPDEHRSFTFFLERTSHQLSGFYECQFWNGVILQAAHQDSALRYAIVALASLHEGYEKTGEADRAPDDFALQKYNLAIRQHLRSLARPSTDRSKIESYVASCMVFICIELIQGHYVSALSLVKGAVQLFYNGTIDFRSTSGWPTDVFEGILSRLQSQAVDLLSAEIVGEVVLPRAKIGLKARMPVQFKSLSQAKAYLEHYLHSATLSRPLTSVTIGDNARIYMDIVNSWKSAFDKLIDCIAPTMTDQDERAANILRIWFTLMEIGIGMRLEHAPNVDDQTLWDLYEHKTEEVVRLAGLVLDDSEDVHEVPYRFTIDFGLVGPLYDTARLCRDPIIRRRAIHLLQSHPRREGLWDGRLAAAAAQKQMELEEAAVPEVNVAEDIPGWARISVAMPTFAAGERCASMIYIRQKPMDGSEPVKFYETLDW